jgi:hypothetical protein
MGEVKKLFDVRLSLSIKPGTKEENYLTSQYYDMEMSGDFLKVTCKKTGTHVNTSIHNMIQWRYIGDVETKPTKKTVKNVSK